MYKRQIVYRTVDISDKEGEKIALLRRGKKKLLFRGIATGTKSSASPCAKSTGIFFAAAHGIHGGTNLPAAPQARQDPQAQSKLFYQPHERSPAINCITWHTAHQGAYRKNLQKSRLDILNILYILFIYSKTKENPVRLSIDNRSCLLYTSPSPRD